MKSSIIQNQTIVSVSGYGATGSSAVVDLLKDCEAIDVLDDFEFQILYFPDGISDLDYKLNCSASRFYDSDLAIVRFLELCKKLDNWYMSAFQGHLYEYAKEYIDSLNPITWSGYWAYDRLSAPANRISVVDAENALIHKRNCRVHFVNRCLRKLGMPQFNDKKPYKAYYDERTMYMKIKPDDFVEKTQQFIWKLIQIAKHNTKTITAINQFLPPQNPVMFEKYLPCKVKSIVVSRDPRDLWMHYHILKKSQHSPRKNVNEFIEWYRENMRKDINLCSDTVLRISFEDTIYKTKETIDLILKFLDIDNNCIEFYHFNPHKSVANTQLFLKNRDCEDDINKISKELNEYLFPYNEYDNVSMIPNTKVF